jgi:DNA polymerase III delta subunit
MIYLVHGDDIAKSRNLILNQQVKLGVESRIELDLSDTTPEKLYETLHSSGLFNEQTLVVFNVSKAGRTNVEPYLIAMNKIPESITLVILSDKNLSSTNTFIKNSTKINAREILSNKVPEGDVFKLIDALYNKQRDRAYLELRKLEQQDRDPFEIYSMLVYGLRNVAHAKFNSKTYQGMKDFMKAKINSQQRQFSEEQIKNLYRDFSQTDKEMKLGIVGPDLALTLVVEKVLNS